MIQIIVWLILSLCNCYDFRMIAIIMNIITFQEHYEVGMNVMLTYEAYRSKTCSLLVQTTKVLIRLCFLVFVF